MARLLNFTNQLNIVDKNLIVSYKYLLLRNHLSHRPGHQLKLFYNLNLKKLKKKILLTTKFIFFDQIF
jgi:hypothetical protein